MRRHFSGTVHRLAPCAPTEVTAWSEIGEPFAASTVTWSSNGSSAGTDGNATSHTLEKPAAESALSSDGRVNQKVCGAPTLEPGVPSASSKLLPKYSTPPAATRSRRERLICVSTKANPSLRAAT